MSRRRNSEGFRVFQPEYTARSGKKRRSPRHHVEFRDHNSIRRRLPAFTDYSASVSFGRKVRELDDLRAVGESPRGDLARWVDGLTDDVRAKLIDWSILDQRASMMTLPLAEHIEDWHQSILNNGRTKTHADRLKTQVSRLITACGFARFARITELEVQTYLSGLTCSAQTRNHAAHAVKQFSTWMVRHGRATQSPVSGLEMLNVRADRKRVRRALGLDDLINLLNVTRHGPTRGKTTGIERSLIYWVAVETGLRASELRSLTAGSFDLVATPPTVTVEAGFSKRRRRDTLSLTDDLAAALRTHLASKLPSAAAFTIPGRTAEMLKADLKRAKIPYRDPVTGEFYDFHSLRYQLATNLVRGGAHPAVMQARMRHSTVRLTMDIYARVGKDGQTAALDALPRLSVGA
ncbi:MAG: site-specific integrase [Phycisphaerales bacterium]